MEIYFYFVNIYPDAAYSVTITESERIEKMNQDNARVISYHTPLDHQRLTEILTVFHSRYPFLEWSDLGTSILGRSIPLLRLGHGETEILYVGAHHGMEWITSVILLRFLNEFCEAKREPVPTLYQIDLNEFCERYSVFVVPMLNPDGVEYQIHGFPEKHPLYPRLLRMTGGSTDASRWQANARGVDLNHNYDAGFWDYKKTEAPALCNGAPTKYSGVAPESEPETAALCGLLRFHTRIRAVLTFHTQGEVVYWQSGGKSAPGAAALARKISCVSGYPLAEATGSAAYGGLSDWCIRDRNLPSFTIECGKGRNPLPLTDYFPIYANLRKLLFSFPTWLA